VTLHAGLAWRAERARAPRVVYAEVDRLDLEMPGWSWRKMRRLIGELVALGIVSEPGPDAYLIHMAKLEALPRRRPTRPDERSRRWAEASVMATTAMGLHPDLRLVASTLATWGALDDEAMSDRPIPPELLV
jgi:hypothetical protein